jgi:hypothetical protein
VPRIKMEIAKARIAALPPPRPASALFRTPAEAFAEPWLPPLSTHRARLSKRRKRQGLHYVALLVSEEAIDALVQLQFLPREQRASRSAITKAVAAHLYASLVERFQNTLWAKAERQNRANQPKGSIRGPNGRWLPWKSPSLASSSPHPVRNPSPPNQGKDALNRLPQPSSPS